MNELHRLLGDLVAIDSVNPDLVPGGAGEAELARFVGGWLEDAGLEVELDEVTPGRVNVIGRVAGTGGGRSLLLNAHMDVVGIDGVERPFEPRVEDGRLYGRGAYDMKAGLAAIMWAGAAAARNPAAGDVIVTGVCDEEFASIGAQALAKRVRADAAIVTEPSGAELAVCVAHKGFSWHTIEVSGRAAHGSRPEEGIDAISKMGSVLVALERLDQRVRSGARHPLLGTGSLHASLIEGGRELSTYPDRCVLQLERRTIPGESADVVEAELTVMLEELAAVDPELRATLETTLVRDPFEVAADAPIVEAVRDAAGRDLPVIGVPFWADSAIFASAGIPTVIHGPGGAGAHAAVEYVELGQLDRVAETLIEVTRTFCG
ncbi:MAG: acetylornithine deacetylase [Gaiellales bacterium]|jgi:acetylornithine deacetylase|nr:acetylornithine deacetylase [Gaiellales bacterium]